MYFTLGVTPYHDRWCHPSRLGCVRDAVRALAAAPVGTGEEPLCMQARVTQHTCDASLEVNDIV